MLYRFRKSLATRRFARLTQAVLDTPPMPVVPGPATFVSMVANHDVQMYVLSMKSVYRRVGRGQLLAIVDRDMPADARSSLRAHFPGIEFQVLEDIDVGVCQRGGTWERLVHLLDRTRDGYVVQVDCDTLAYGADVAEVVDCIAANRAFTLGGGSGVGIVTLEAAAGQARAEPHRYVGIAAEALLDQLPRPAEQRYVRGSSGFAGFAKGGFNRAALEDFHARMACLLPSRWQEWGTEQCASNFAVANTPGACVLPGPKYWNFDRRHDTSQSSFLHFIGSNRFDDDRFAQLGQREIAKLCAA